MTQLALEHLPEQMAKLVRDAQSGEEIMFTENNKPVARLVLVENNLKGRKAGSAKHLCTFSQKRKGFEVYNPLLLIACSHSCLKFLAWPDFRGDDRTHIADMLHTHHLCGWLAGQILCGNVRRTPVMSPQAAVFAGRED